MSADFCFADSQAVLIPIEHLSPEGLSPRFSEWLVERRPNGAAVARLLDGAFPLYWQRSRRLANAVPAWPPPRVRNVAVIASGSAIPPYVQVLNTSTWTLFDCDFDAATSSVEFVAYLLVHGDWMSATGEVTRAALLCAPYWHDRSEEEIAEFQRGARSTVRPDAEAYAALAASVAWLRRLHHRALRSAPPPAGAREIAGTGILVPTDLAAQPAALIERWSEVAKATVHRWYTTHATTGDHALAATLEWLRDEPHTFVITGRGNRVLWDCEHPQRLGALRHELRRGTAAALGSLRDDLAVIDHHSNDFRDRALRYPELPLPADDTGQDGYTYLYRGRRVLAYNLEEPNLDRLRVPALPYARPMLGARAYHEWCHLAVRAGWVRCTAADEDLASLLGELRDAFDDAIAMAPELVRRGGGADLLAMLRTEAGENPVDWGCRSTVVAGRTGGGALVRMMLPRFADYQANLLAARLQSATEREAYVRQNIRTLRAEYERGGIWRMFARYLYELQYLRFADVGDAWTYFARSTWFDDDFLASGVTTLERVQRIDRAYRAIFDTFAVDDSAIRLPESGN